MDRIVCKRLCSISMHTGYRAAMRVDGDRG